MSGSVFEYNEAFSRNLGLVSFEEQDKIRRTKIALAGLGGCGAIYLETFLRCGLEQFHLADLDNFELVNFNRQSGAFVDTIGKPKLDSMIEFGKRINPELKVSTFPNGIQPDNLNKFLEGVDIVVDAIEVFEIDIRRQLYNAAQQRGIPVIFGAPLGYTATLQIYGATSPKFDDYFDIKDSMSDLEKVIQFIMGISPAIMHLNQVDPKSVDLRKRKGPSLSPSVKLCAGMLGAQVLNLILKRHKVNYVPAYMQLDGLTQRIKKGVLWGGNKNPIQKLKRMIARKRFIKK